MIKIKFESGESKEFNLTTFDGSDLSNLKLHTAIFEGYSMCNVNFNYTDLRNVN
ncbi:pentapeptide repeat-containing protein, partial [Gilliamella apicola]